MVNGKQQIVVGGSDYVTGHDVGTGKELWRGGGLNPEKSKTFRVIASPLVRDGMIFAPTRVKPFIAFKAGGTGDITTSHLAWKWTERGSPDVPTPVSDGERLYMADDRGSITCVNAKTGERIYGPEATGLGTISASPILADGKIYITSEAGRPPSCKPVRPTSYSGKTHSTAATRSARRPRWTASCSSARVRTCIA